MLQLIENKCQSAHQVYVLLVIDSISTIVSNCDDENLRGDIRNLADEVFYNLYSFI